MTADGFRDSSQPLAGALFTFPSRYSSTIGHQDVFRLSRWSCQIHTEFPSPCYSGTHPTPRPRISPTGLSPSTVPFPTGFGYPQRQCSRPANPDRHAPQPHTRNPCRVSHAHGLASSPFAHHYSGNHSCFLLLRVLRCFTSPRSHQLPYTFRQRRRAITHARFPHSDTHGSTLGWQLPVAYRGLPRPSSAPGAKASTVCHTRLATTETRRSHTLSTNQNPRHTPNQHTTRHAPARMARTTPTHPHHRRPTAQHGQHLSPSTTAPINHRPQPKPTSHLRLSTDNDPGAAAGYGCSLRHPTGAPTHHQRQAGKNCLSTHRATPQHTRHTPCSTQREASTFEPADHQHTPDTPCIQHTVGFKLLRKEVIQPHLPVRLPCYDFVPIASPTFTRSPPQRVRPRVSGVADFRDVTGGVYKARERIHRGVADPRLLATPPSWGRVADPNPN